MPTSCCAYNCTERSVGGGPISFHRFPTKDKLLFRAWCVALRRKDFHPTWSSRVCSKHFTKDSYEPGFKYRKLKRDAVPTIFNFGKWHRKKWTKKNRSQNTNKIDIYEREIYSEDSETESTLRQSQTYEVSVNNLSEDSMTFDELVEVDNLPCDRLKSMQNENEVLRHTILQLNERIERFKSLTDFLPSRDLIEGTYLSDEESVGSSENYMAEQKPKVVEIIKVTRYISSECGESENNQEQQETTESIIDSLQEIYPICNKLGEIDFELHTQFTNIQNENEVLRKTIHNLKENIKRFKCLTYTFQSHDLIDKETAQALKNTIDV